MQLPRTLFVLLFTLVILSGCGAIETIFKAGMWWAFFLVFLAIALIVVVIAKVRKK